MLTLAKKIEAQNGKGYVFVGDYVFNLDDILKKLKETKNKTLTYDLSKNGGKGFVKIDAERMKQLLLSGEKFKFAGQKYLFPIEFVNGKMQFAGVGSNIVSIIKYLVIAGLIFGIIYYVKKAFTFSTEGVKQFFRKPGETILKSIGADVISDEDWRKLEQSHARLFKAQAKHMDEKIIYNTLDFLGGGNEAEIENVLHDSLIEGAKGEYANHVFTMIKKALKRPWKDIFFQYIAHHDEGHGLLTYEDVKTTFGFKQSIWREFKDVLKGDAWKEKFYALWDDAIKRTIDRAMVLFELDRRIAGVTDSDMAIALKSKGYSVKYPDKQYFLKAAKSLKGLIS